MNLRPLTKEEKDLLRAAKNVANERLRAQRAVLRQKLRAAANLTEEYEIKQDLNDHAPTKGSPVRIYDPETFEALTVDYDKLRQFFRTLKGWTVKALLSYGVLDVTYHHTDGRKGQAKIYGLTDIELNALEGAPLPAVAIATEVAGMALNAGVSRQMKLKHN